MSEVKMLSAAELDEIIQHTNDVAFVNQCLLARSQEMRGRLERTRQRAYLAIERLRVENEQVAAAKIRVAEKRRVSHLILVMSEVEAGSV